MSVVNAVTGTAGTDNWLHCSGRAPLPLASSFPKHAPTICSVYTLVVNGQSWLQESTKEDAFITLADTFGHLWLPLSALCFLVFGFQLISPLAAGCFKEIILSL